MEILLCTRNWGYNENKTDMLSRTDIAIEKGDKTCKQIHEFFI